MTESRWIQMLILLIICANFSLQAVEEVEEEKSLKEWFEEEAAYARYSLYVREIINSFAEQMKRELNLQCKGEGGTMQKEVKEILVKFQANRRATLEEARALQLYAMNKLMETINRHESIQFYLIERPFPLNRVAISISFEKNGVFLDNNVALVFNTNDSAIPENINTIAYYYHDPFLKDHIEILHETYKEAAQKTKDSGLVFPFTHMTTDREVVWDVSLLLFTNWIMQERGIFCTAIGEKIEGNIEEIGGTFRVFHRASQEEARKLAIFATENLFEYINRNNKLKPFLKQHPLLLNQLKMSIYFTNEQYHPYHDGSIVSVVLEAGELSYYHRVRIPDEGDKEFWITEKTLFAKETYQKALENIQESQSISVFSKIHRAIGRWFGYEG